MDDTDKTKEQLIDELGDLRHQIIELAKEKTERMKMQESLRESKQLLQKAQAISHLGHYKLNPYTNVVEGSDELFNIFGLSREDFQFLDFVDTVHPDDRDYVTSTIQRSIEKRENYDIEHYLLLRDGTLKIIKANGEPVLDSAGNIAFMVGTVQDITEQKKAENALRKSREHLRLALGAARIAVWDWNVQENYTIWSDTAEEVLGFQRGSFGSNYEAYMKWVHPDDIEPINKRVSRALEEKQVDYRSEYRMIRPNGEIRWITAPGQVFYDSTGEPVRISGIMMDITEHKKAEEELQKAKHKLEERVKELNCLYDISKLSGEIEKSLDEIIQSIVNLIPSSWQYPKITCAKILLNGKSFNTINLVETKWRQSQNIIVSGEKAGSIEIFYIEERPESDEGPFLKEERDLIDAIAERIGKIIEFRRSEEELQKAKHELEERVKERTAELEVTVELLQDEITDRKRTENELKESEEKYRALFEEAPDGIVLFDTEKGIWADFNDKVYKTLGYTREEFQKLKLSDIEVIESPDEIQMHVDKLFEEGSDVFETKHRKKDGEILDILVSNQALNIGGKKFAQGIYTDITERKKAGAILKKSEKKYRDIVETSNEGIWIIDSQANTTFANKRMEELLGYTAEEMIGRHLFEFMDKDAVKEAERRFERLREGMKAIHDFRFKRKDGSNIWTSISTSPLVNDKGEFTGALGMLTDITERKNAEEELAKAKEEIEIWNKELEKRVREKSEELVKSQEQLIQSEKLSAMGEMSGGLAHELNSPLAGLLPMLEQYRNKAVKDSREYKEFSLMYKASEYMAKIVRDFSSFARESKGEYFELNLNKVIDDTLSFITSRFKQKGIQMVREYEDALPEIKGEKTELQQVVLNIVTNALDAMPESGKFIIKTVSKNKKVSMEFIDNGAGIEKEYLNKIFDPFYTTKRPGKGTGLGLSLSYKIIEKHGGKISVESKTGEGTKFKIYLPAVKFKNIKKDRVKNEGQNISS